ATLVRRLRRALRERPLRAVPPSGGATSRGRFVQGRSTHPCQGPTSCCPASALAPGRSRPTADNDSRLCGGGTLCGESLGRDLAELGFVCSDGLGHRLQPTLLGRLLRKGEIDPAAERLGAAGRDGLVPRSN